MRKKEIWILTLLVIHISYAVCTAKAADGFYFPVIKDDPIDANQSVFNYIDPLTNGWAGDGVGATSADYGHLGQDYYLKIGTSAGKRVYAAANGTVVEIMDFGTKYGWCDNDHHGWGRVIVIKHEAPPGTTFITNGSIVSAGYIPQDDRYPGSTEMNPTVIYTLYGHLSRTDLEVREGDVVNAGQPIARIGSYPDEEPWPTPHLHFEIKSQKGFDEGVWSNQNPGTHLKPQSCNAQGIGSGYSYINGYAPERYNPTVFIANNTNARPCHTLTPSSQVPAGFGVPWDVLNPSIMLVSATCSGSGVILKAGTPNPNPIRYIYKDAYTAPSGASSWTPTPLFGSSLISGAWYQTSAQGSTIIQDTSKPLFYVAYACTWIPPASGQAGKWMCGCRDAVCTQSYWQLQGIQPMTGTRAVNMAQVIVADLPLPPPPPPSPSLAMTLSLNQTAFRTGNTLRVGLGARNPDPAFMADFYFGVLLPDGVTALFVTSLSPLNGVVARLDADARTFRPLLANVQLPQGLDTTLPDFFVYSFAGGEPVGTYTAFAFLTPPGAFNDGRIDPGDLLVIDTRPFSFSP